MKKKKLFRQHVARILTLLMLVSVIDAGAALLGLPVYTPAHQDAYAVSMGVDIQQGDTIVLKADGWNREYLVLDAQKTNSGESGAFVLQKFFYSGQQLKFDEEDEASNVWEGSDAQQACTDYYLSMPASLRDMVIGVETSDTGAVGSNNINGKRTGEDAAIDKVFAMSFAEYYRYRDYIPKSFEWWLRSPDSSGNNMVRYVDRNGDAKATTAGSTKVLRPAFNLDLPEEMCASSKELADGTTEWTVDLDTLGHSYGDPVYTWYGGGEECTAEAVCANCGKVVREKSDASSDLAEDGSTVYTATFENSLFETQVKTVKAGALTSTIKQGDVISVLVGDEKFEFIVLDPLKNSTGGDGMFLLLKESTEKTAYDTSEQSNQWEGSTAQTWCTEFYRSLPDSVRSWVVGVKTQDSESGQPWLGVNNIDGTKSDKDKVFFLAYKEYQRYRDVAGVVAPYKWLLRNYGVDCASDIHAYVGVIQENGEPKDYGIHSELSARPAFNIELPDYVKASRSVSGGTVVWSIDAANPSVAPAAPEKPSPAEVKPSGVTEKKDLPSVKLTKPKGGKKKITVKWKKISKKNRKKIAGIEIQIATDPKFKKIVKKTTAGKTKKSKTIKGLKKKRTYWVRIRAYKKTGKVKHVSKWSKPKKVRVK